MKISRGSLSCSRLVYALNKDVISNKNLCMYVCVLSLQKYPPKKDKVRAVSIQTGYMIQDQGPTNHCTLTYLAQVDPRGN